MYIHRLLENSFKEALKTFPAVVITGSRQCGKTTLVKNLLRSNYNYVSLDELDIRSFALSDPRGFLEKYSCPLIIDEIQLVPELLSYIKAKIDHDRKPGQWVLTGSQAFALMRNISESLAGRVAVLSLHTFSLEEMKDDLRPKADTAEKFIKYLKTTDKLTHTPSVGKWLLRGGYPEIFVNKNISLKLWFSSYLQAYIDRDVRGNIKNANLHDFERFIKLLAARTAQELNYSSISSDLGISVPTIKSWVSLLEASSLIYLLYPYHNNFGKRIIKTPKCYFLDTGLVSYLVGLQDEAHLLNGPMAGALFETACVTQFVKRFSAFNDPASLYFWRSIEGFEVDLIIDIAGKLFPVEFKLSSTIYPRHLASVQAWQRVAGKLSADGLIISSSTQIGSSGARVANCHFSVL